jgi:rubrerythrin
MSEKEKRLREETIKETREWLKKGGVDLSKDFKGNTENENEMILRIAELKRREERTREMIRAKIEEQKRIVREIIAVIDARRGDEARDSSTYFNLARKYQSIPTVSRLFQELSEAEDSHQKKLMLLGNELERKLKQTS